MNNILNLIKYIPSSRIFLISENKNYTYKDIRNLYNKNKKIIDSLKNCAVVINSRSSVECILLLSILDGFVKRIVFLPDDINLELVEEYYEKAKINFEVSLGFNTLKIKKVSSSFIDTNSNKTQWIITTSGTTKKPKMIVHTFDSLTRTTKKNIKVGSSFIWGLCYDIYRFSGIQVFLQVLASGSSIIVPQSSSSISKIIEFFVKNNCNIISATPSFWRKILMAKASCNLELKRATLGGEIAEQTILNAIKNKYKDIKIVHIYASSEVGVGFTISDFKAGFPYDFVINGINGMNLRISEDSLLFIKPNKKEQDYLSLESMYDNEGFINTGDLVKVEEDRVFFLGRESGSINVGGNKVQPEEVEQKLLMSNLMQEIYVYSKKSSMLGSLVCVDIVPKDLKLSKQELKKEIFTYCKRNLEKYKIPAFLNIVDELPITRSGKIKRGK